MTPEQKAKVAASEYEVGFGKTPEVTRFKAGASGNPTGRPKGKTTRTLLKEKMEDEVIITTKGVSREVKYREALVEVMAANALKGGPRALEHMLRTMMQQLPEEFEEPPKKQLTPDRTAILERFRRRNSG